MLNDKTKNKLKNYNIEEENSSQSRLLNYMPRDMRMR